VYSNFECGRTATIGTAGGTTTLSGVDAGWMVIRVMLKY